MSMFVLLLALSAVNVGVGYALAVYLGYGPPSFRAAWTAMGSGRPAAKLNPAAPEATTPQ